MKDLQTLYKPTKPPEKKTDFFPTWIWGPILNSQETSKNCPLTHLNMIQSGYVTTLFFKYCDQPDLLKSNNSAISFAVYRVYLSECTGIYIARVPSIVRTVHVQKLFAYPSGLKNEPRLYFWMSLVDRQIQREKWWKSTNITVFMPSCWGRASAGCWADPSTCPGRSSGLIPQGPGPAPALPSPEPEYSIAASSSGLILHNPTVTTTTEIYTARNTITESTLLSTQLSLPN